MGRPAELLQDRRPSRVLVVEGRRLKWPAPILAAILFHPGIATAGTYLSHKPRLSLPERVRFLERSVARDRMLIRWYRSPAAPRTVERVSELRWYGRALRWQTRTLAHYRRHLQPARPARPVLDSCLAAIIDNEGSGWNPHATNPSTGAYGLPQALPGSKMASAGADWRDNPATQIRWMRGYVNGRYGGSCAALAFWNAHRWY